MTVTPGTNNETVADHALALMLAALRSLRRLDADVRGGGWRDFSLPLSQLYGSTVGVVGFGAIGQAVGRRVEAFGATLLVYDPLGAASGELVELDELLRRSDVVSLHLPLSPRDRRADRRPPAGADAGRRDPRQHLARPGSRPGGADRGPDRRPPRRRRPRRLRRRAARPWGARRARRTSSCRRTWPGSAPSRTWRCRGWQPSACWRRWPARRAERLPTPTCSAPTSAYRTETRWTHRPTRNSASRSSPACGSELAPVVEEIEDTESIPREKIWPALREMGAFKLLVPERYGGYELTVRQYLPIIAELSKVHGGIRAMIHVHNSIGHALHELGDERHRLGSAARGRRRAPSRSPSLSPSRIRGTGADTATTARREGDDLRDQRPQVADHQLRLGEPLHGLRQDHQRAASESLSTILVERDAPGLSIEPLPETMGCKGGQHGLLTFTDAVVPAANLLGEEGDGIGQDGGGAGDQPRLRRRLLARHRRVRARALARARQVRARPSASRSPSGRRCSATWPRWRPTSTRCG